MKTGRDGGIRLAPRRALGLAPPPAMHRGGKTGKAVTVRPIGECGGGPLPQSPGS